jgi:glycosyltransferase involved in cell wall biosynthesis
MPSTARRKTLIHVMNDPFALQYLRGQPTYMAVRGIDCAVVVPRGDGFQEFRVSEGVACHEATIVRNISPMADIRTLARLVRLWWRMRPDIVHAHTPKGGLLGMLSATIAGVPGRVYTLHGLTYMTASGTLRQVLRWSDWLSCRLADRVICVSKSIREVVIEDGICDPDKLVVVAQGSANGVDAVTRFNPDRFSESDFVQERCELGIGPDALVLTFVGRIVQDKGIEELTHAWLRLREQYPHLHLLIVGPMEERDAVVPWVLEVLHEDGRVHFTGFRGDVDRVMAITDVVAVPSRREGFGIVFIEAGAMEVPVVATRIPGCIDAVVDGVTGTLVPSYNAYALHDAISRYLDDPELRWKHGRAGRERVLREFRPEDVWEGIHAEYERLLNQRERGSRPGCWPPFRPSSRV